MNEPDRRATTSNHFYPPWVQKFLQGSYFWDLRESSITDTQNIEDGNVAVRTIFPNDCLETWQAVINAAIQTLDKVYGQVEHGVSGSEQKHVADVALSSDLQTWREEQHRAGRKLRSKGDGLTRISNTVSGILNVGDWSPCLLSSAAFYGCFHLNMLIGAHDPETMYSNYCVDMGFFIDHGYHRIFPEFETILAAEIANPHSPSTLGGSERRRIAELGLVYFRHKTQLEEKHMKHLTNKTARVSLDELLTVMLCETGIIGMAAEAMARGFDSTTVAFQFIMSNPAEDLVDVGCDIINSELFNSLLNTADITDSGIITEETLRNVYNAYAHCMSPVYTVHWKQTGSRVCSTLLSWHIQNDRHHFLRRALLGYSKVQKGKADQREADVDEAFDEHMRTTGYSKPLRNACDGKGLCNQVQELLHRTHGEPMLKSIWFYFAEGPLEYVAHGIVDECQEDDLVEGSCVAMARAASHGLIEDMAWLLCHANVHALQVNRLNEAAMFGSLLDDGGLMGKMDRKW
ncbi:hypothetical protein BDV25DRAFT_138306 [Aspergillus avenaceus]|uniref:Uncharacterized protein n=1 Tax=Aspergillus avenaceus TaxID=36643 RepID=A0A5N6U091_ASPAV|nr:hypothetical protein BDV25DRAFT_138306 [Aspergillus avenaceus]